MNSSFSDAPKIAIRSVQYRDLDAIANLTPDASDTEQQVCTISLRQQLQQARRWFGLFKFLSWFPNPFQHEFRAYIAESQGSNSFPAALRGFIQVSPFNSSRSTWRVERVIAASGESQPELLSDPKGVGSQLLRHCFEKIWEARTWVLEVNINENKELALYRQNGFQPLAQLTYWSLFPELLENLAQHEPNLPNLLPVSNADAQLLYQLDCVSMPPLLRQVFDRHILDFKTHFLSALMSKFQHWYSQTDVVSGYVFEPQRKAAIGYFKLNLCKDGSRPHHAQLTVHPAYTWLYPQLLAQMAQIVQPLPPQSLELVSADYQHEREEYLGQLGAERIEHTLLMSRSVWHKLKETKPEGLHLSEVFQGLQSVPRTPIPSRLSWLKMSLKSPDKTSPNHNGSSSRSLSSPQQEEQSLESSDTLESGL